jgi:hypothetical protein
MMTPRRVVGLLIASAVIVAVAFWLSSRGHRSDLAVAGHPLLDGLRTSVNDVTELRIAKGDGARVTLKKLPDAWQVVEREYPADSGKVRKLLLDLGALQVVEEKTSDPASYERIGVEDVKGPKATGTQVEAVTPKKSYSVIAGRSAGMKSSYVRVTGAPKSYLVSPQIMAEANPKQWLAKDVLDIPEARIKEVAVTPATGPAYTVSREKKEQTDFTVSNVPKGRELSSPGAGNPLAGELLSFTLDDVRKDANAAGAAKPAGASSATFRTFDGLELQVNGQKDGDRHYVSIAPRSTAKETATEAQTLEAHVKGWQYEIPGYKYDLLFKPLDELLKKPEPKEEKKSSDKKAGAKKPATAGPPTPPTS